MYPDVRHHTTRSGGADTRTEAAVNDLIWQLAPALQRLEAGEHRFVELFRHGSMSLELYAPRGADPQA